MTVKLLTEHHLEFLSLRGDCTGSSESTLVKMPHCWISHVAAQMPPLFKDYKGNLLQISKMHDISMINRGSNMSAHVLSNLSNEMGGENG